MHFSLKVLYWREEERAYPPGKALITGSIFPRVIIYSKCPKAVAVKFRAEGRNRAHRPTG